MTDPIDPDDVEAAEQRASVPAEEQRGLRRPARRATSSSQRSDVPAYEQKAGPVSFVNQSVDELKKVAWPTKEEMGGYFVAVLVFVVFIMLLVSLLDTGLGWVVLKVFGS
ncbi:preprotein translocase subunit SecE [Raineyella antarctica]|nr:preprotein translocase subunit SecE [Raineyella antarctica]